MSSSPRDKDATWRSLGILCRERGWSKSRALHELQNGLPYQTVPPLPSGRSIDWRNPNVAYGLNVETGDLTLVLGAFGGGGLGFDTLTVSIEVLPPAAPTDAELPAPSATAPPATAPAAAPAPRRPSAAAVEQCLRVIMKERPDNPPGENELFVEMTQRLGASPGRDRLRQLRRRIAPQWKRPRGHPAQF